MGSHRRTDLMGESKKRRALSPLGRTAASAGAVSSLLRADSGLVSQQLETGYVMPMRVKEGALSAAHA